MRKQEHVSALATVVIETAPWHSSGGWYCDRCSGECGEAIVTLCDCCATALDALTIAVTTSERGGGL